MTLALVIRMRGWLAPVLLGVAVLAVSAFFGDVSAAAPMADGPRHLRHYLVGLVPSFAAGVLVDHAPTISRSLAKEAFLRRFDLAVYWVVAASALPATLGPAAATVEGRYCVVVWLLLTAIGVLFVKLLASEGIFASALLGIVWLVFGDTVAPLLGFDLMAPPGMIPLPDAPLLGAVLLAMACTLIGHRISGPIGSR